jgi:hypothetical protein
MTLDDAPPPALMDRVEVRAAFIDLRVAELRTLAAWTAVEFWREWDRRRRRREGRLDDRLTGG